MKKLLLALFACISTFSFAQGSGNAGPANLTSGQCLQMNVFTSQTTAITLTGTWTGTLQAQVFANPPRVSYVTPIGQAGLQPSMTTNGIYTTTVYANNIFQVCALSITGTVTVQFSAPIQTSVTQIISAQQCIQLNVFVPGQVAITVNGAWSGVLQPYIYLSPEVPASVIPLGSSQPQQTIIQNGAYSTYVTTPNVSTICALGITGSATVQMVSAGNPNNSGFTASGDLAGTSLSQTVVGLEGLPLPNLAINNGFLQANAGVLSVGPASIGVYTVAGLPVSPTNGTIAVVTNGQGSQDCTVGGGTTYVLCHFQTGSGWSVFSGSNGIGVFTVATLPAAPPSGTVAVVSNGASGTDCVVGGGTIYVLCRFVTGSGWGPFPAGVSSAGGLNFQTQVNNGGSLGGITNGPQGGVYVSQGNSAFATFQPKAMIDVRDVPGFDCTGVTDSFTAASTTFVAGASVMMPRGCTLKIGTNLTIPSTVTIYFTQGAYFIPSNNVVITHKGSVVAGTHQQLVSIANGGTMLFWGVDNTYADWWGAANDGVTDDCLPLQAAINATYSQTLILTQSNPFAKPNDTPPFNVYDYVSSCRLVLNGSPSPSTNIGRRVLGNAGSGWYNEVHINFTNPASGGIRIMPLEQGAEVARLYLDGGAYGPTPGFSSCWNQNDSHTWPDRSLTGDGPDGIQILAGETYIHDLAVFCFMRNGILVSGDSTLVGSGQPDETKLQNVQVDGNRGYGVFYVGGDANAGYDFGLDSRGNMLGSINDNGQYGNNHHQPVSHGNAQQSLSLGTSGCNLTTIARASNVVTAVCSATPPGTFVTNATIQVWGLLACATAICQNQVPLDGGSFNGGPFTLTSVVGNTLTYGQTGNNISTTNLASAQAGISLGISSVARNSNVDTFVTAVNHGLTMGTFPNLGPWVTINGTTPDSGSFNFTCQVTSVISVTSFTCAQTGNNITTTASVGGLSTAGAFNIFSALFSKWDVGTRYQQYPCVYRSANVNAVFDQPYMELTNSPPCFASTALVLNPNASMNTLIGGGSVASGIPWQSVSNVSGWGEITALNGGLQFNTMWLGGNSWQFNGVSNAASFIQFGSGISQPTSELMQYYDRASGNNPTLRWQLGQYAPFGTILHFQINDMVNQNVNDPNFEIDPGGALWLSASGNAANALNFQNWSTGNINFYSNSAPTIQFTNNGSGTFNNSVTTPIIQGSVSASSVSALAGIILRAGDNSSTGTAGSVMISPGQNTSTGQQGIFATAIAMKKGATVTQWNLQCSQTTAMQTQDCAASPANIIGVAETVGAAAVRIIYDGESPINASAAVTLGHTVCAGTTAGQITDSAGTSACANGITVGVVIATSGTWTYPDGTSFTASTTLPLVLVQGFQPGGSGGSSGITPEASFFGAYYCGTATICGFTWLTNLDGVPQFYVEKTAGGVQTAPIGLPAGIVTRASSCPSNADTILLTDRAGLVTWSDASTCTVTLPQAGSTSFGNGFAVLGCNIGNGQVNINPTTSLISYSNGSTYTASASSMPIATAQCAWIFTDQTTSNYFADIRAGLSLINTTSPIVGGPATQTATISCPTCRVNIASGTASMGTAAINSGTCASAVTVTATGTLTTDVIAATPNSDPTTITGYAPSASGSLYIQAYPTANAVNFKVCNDTSSTITPNGLTLNWSVSR